MPYPKRSRIWPASSRPSLTARGVTLLRALEQSRPPSERIVEDPYAATFLEPLDEALLATVRRFPKATTPAPWAGPADGATSILARHRYIDEQLLAALPEAQQVLVLGAGYDCRAYRFADQIGSRVVFEVDLAAISRRKARIVADHPDLFEADPIRVETDFRAGSMVERLLAAGFEPDKRTFVIWEGVTMYLSASAVTQTLSDIRGLCQTDMTWLAADFVTTFEGARPRKVALKIASQSFRLIGEPIRFKLQPDDARAFMTGVDWSVTELLDARDMTARFATAGRRCQPGLYVVSAAAYR